MKTLQFTLPKQIPAPKFGFNQQVRRTTRPCKGVVGVIRGLEYVTPQVAKIERIHPGWSYTVQLSAGCRHWQMHPVIICEESDLEEVS